MMWAVEQIHKLCRKEHELGSSSCSLMLLSCIRMVRVSAGHKACLKSFRMGIEMMKFGPDRCKMVHVVVEESILLQISQNGFTVWFGKDL